MSLQQLETGTQRNSAASYMLNNMVYQKCVHLRHIYGECYVLACYEVPNDPSITIELYSQVQNDPSATKQLLPGTPLRRFVGLCTIDNDTGTQCVCLCELCSMCLYVSIHTNIHPILASIGALRLLACRPVLHRPYSFKGTNLRPLCAVFAVLPCRCDDATLWHIFVAGPVDIACHTLASCIPHAS